LLPLASAALCLHPAEADVTDRVRDHALFSRIGARTKMPFPIHPHMLRHGCGYALANAGHDTRSLQAWLGHKNIQHTVRYTELAIAGQVPVFRKPHYSDPDYGSERARGEPRDRRGFFTPTKELPFST
jgi:site-specific recombinase XerD